MRKQKRIWAYLLSAAMVVTSFTMSGATGKAEGTTEKGEIVSVTDRTSTKKAASVTENGKVASVTNKVSTKKTAGTDSFQDLNRQQITEAMGVGYNLGNSLEANSGGTPNETAWGNPVLTKEFVLAAKAAGFQSIRIPVSYLSKIDDNNGYKIDSAWLDHVQEVVDYCVQNDMYAIVNMHGDGYTTVSGGWLLCASSDQTKIKAKYKACWEQIADRFKNYDEHLIFESMNEEFDGTYGTPNKTAYNNINDYNQIFVDTVRQTGGNNDRRWLLIPGWNTNINYTADNYGFVLPTDQYLSSDIASGEKRIMISVHYYDPWDFCGTESADKTQWGSEATNQSKVPTWGDESYMASQFKKMNDKFVSQGYGEFGAINKANYDTQNKACRADYYQKVCYYAKQYELVPVAWDNGYDGDYGFCLINRYSCQVTHQDIIDAMMEIYRASSTATGIALDQQEITIHVGDAGTQLNATLTPSDSKDIIKWTSDDEKVATVNSNGLVTAVGAGTCTITAAIASGCQATCKVTVPKPSYIRTKLYMLDTSGWTTIASEQSADISTKDEEFTLSVKPTDTQLKNIGSLYIKDIQAAEAADSALNYAVITLKSITVNGKQYTIKDDTYTYDGSLKSAASDGLSNNVFDFSFINIWADVMTHIQDVSAERQKKASFNNASYQGNNTVELTFAVSGAKANGSVEPSTKPSATPSVSPSTAPSSNPSEAPSVSPSTAPSANPSVTPSVRPSTAPSAKPSTKPSVSPSTAPSSKPSTTPSVSPSIAPSPKPSTTPSVSPSTSPSVNPGTDPSVSPSASPSATPSHQLGQPSVTAKGFVVYAKVKGAGKIAVGSRYKLAAKKKMKLTVQWVPRNAASQKLTFKSSRPSIVKVTANGTVKAGKKAGKAVITITTANGLSKKVRIQVMKKPVKKLTVKAGKRNLKKGKKLKLKVKAKPGKKLASTQYCWKSSNKKIAAVSAKGVVKAKKKGTVKITVYATDGSGKKKSVKIKVK